MYGYLVAIKIAFKEYKKEGFYILARCEIENPLY